MNVRVGINGFGRIGRGVFRALSKRNETIQIVAINDLGTAAHNAHLLKYDSVHGTLPQQISATDDGIVVDGQKINFVSHRDPAQIPWKDLGCDIVLECTGLFTARDKAEKHFVGGAKKVIISAPAQNEDITIAMGINHTLYNHKDHHIISNASCTTNCLAPVAKVLHDHFQIKRGLMTTIHSYTNDQSILDVNHSDLRRARAAAVSQIPTTTGAAKAIGLVIPALKGKLDGMAVRVPTPNVSCIDLVCELGKKTSAKELNDLFAAAAAGPLRGVLQFTQEPLVSIDFNGNTHSSIVDGLCTNVLDGDMAKVLAWYDNETGFSNRLLDLVKYIGERLE